MKLLISAVVAAFAFATIPAMAAGHGGGKMDDHKTDCTKKENAEKPECMKK